MFTGIVEELGAIAAVDGDRVRIAATTVTEDARIGDSIAVDGCCLTVVATGEGWWEADVSDETRKRTTLGDRHPGDPVNLERPVRAQDRLGGHIVQGHVDGVGRVISLERLEQSAVLQVAPPAPLERYLVEKGSIAVDGVSLTIAALRPGAFSVALIPFTLERTTLDGVRPGDPVNLEADVIAKYVERLLGTRGSA
jgi:riboflavin synthase